jgi:hypothetical protein
MRRLDQLDKKSAATHFIHDFFQGNSTPLYWLSTIPATCRIAALCSRGGYSIFRMIGSSR